MTDDELHEAIAANLAASWTTVVYRRDGARRVKSTCAVAGETAVALTLVPDDAEALETERLIDLHVHRALEDTARPHRADGALLGAASLMMLELARSTSGDGPGAAGT